MSLIPVGVTILGSQLLELLSPVFIRPRFIGPFVADVTVEERHSDELMITEHPVEQGAAISDHAYKRPARVTIRAGWSNSSPRSRGDLNYVNAVYDQFLLLQSSLEIFSVVTGKRIYDDMMVHRLDVTTDERTENALMMTCECRQVILTSTQTVKVPPSAGMKSPSLNAPTQNVGLQPLAPGASYNATRSPVTQITVNPAPR